MGGELRHLVDRPWKKLMEQIGWGTEPFHTSEFIQRLKRLSPEDCQKQIEAINGFVCTTDSYRFAVTTHKGTGRPTSVDGHQVVSMGITDMLRRMVATWTPTFVALILNSPRNSISS